MVYAKDLLPGETLHYSFLGWNDVFLNIHDGKVTLYWENHYKLRNFNRQARFKEEGLKATFLDKSHEVFKIFENRFSEQVAKKLLKIDGPEILTPETLRAFFDKMFEKGDGPSSEEIANIISLARPDPSVQPTVKLIQPANPPEWIFSPKEPEV